MDYNQNQKKDSSGTWKATTVVLGLLSLLLGGMLWNTKNTSALEAKKLVAANTEMLNAERTIDSLSAQLDIKINELNQLGGKVEDLEALKVQLEKDKESLRKGSVSAGALQSKLRGYEAQLREKDEVIAKLRAENETLISENTGLTTQVQTLNSANTDLNSKYSNLQGEKAKADEEIVTYSTKNKELNDKVNIAAALKADNVKVFAISSSGRERDREKYRSKRVDKLKISFNLAPNKIAVQELKDVYVRILGPDGAIISDEATGSGTFMYAGKETVFTTRQQIAYTNNNQEANIVYARGQKYADGKYSVKLFAEGFQIGEGTFTVK
jgi:outer membrane murein-binding lipoprotein Lpp